MPDFSSLHLNHEISNCMKDSFFLIIHKSILGNMLALTNMMLP